jgi:hypothetical protein
MVSKILVMESNVLMTDSKIMSVSFRAQRRGDVEPPSEAECATASPRARQTAVDVDQDATKSTQM